jgi:putative ubiquitin-RnfH superfamily antitoxin RatB of RatAB toxin-antitoxin module
MINVEIVYARLDKSVINKVCQLPDNSTVYDALMTSNMLVCYPEITGFTMGIFSKRVTNETLLYDGARLEIYRPLLLDPKEKRRQRAKLT